MRWIQISLLLLLCNSSLYAHDSNKAYFTITQNNNNILVQAEFPWTIRKALMQFKPSLEKANKTTVFKQALFDYVSSSLVIRNYNENKFKLLSITEVSSAGHSHQIDYLFTFEAGNIASITNTLLFTVNTNQINYHTIKQSKVLTFETSNEHPTFVLKHVNDTSVWFWLIIPVVLIGALLLLIKKKSVNY